MLILLVFLSTSVMATELTPSLPEGIKSFVASQPGTPRLFQDSRKVVDGVLSIGFIQPDLATETFDPESQALLYIVLQRHDGTVSEVARTAPFGYYTAGGKTNVETFGFDSDTRFSIQFNHRGSCGGGYTIYRFALVRNKWRVSGQDTTSFSCGAWKDGFESADYYITDRSVNFLTGLAVVKETEGAKVVSSKRSRRSFPIFPIEQFVPFDEKYGER
jgi:hypothetical protein